MIKLKFVQIPRGFDPASFTYHQRVDMLASIAIAVPSDVQPFIAWAVAMHEQNGLDYVPGRLHDDIMAEIKANPDVERFCQALGVTEFPEEIADEEPR